MVTVFDRMVAWTQHLTNWSPSTDATMRVWTSIGILVDIPFR